MNNEEFIKILKKRVQKNQIKLPNKIKFEYVSSDSSELKEIKITLPAEAAQDNMQKDECAFEAWALIARAYFPDTKLHLIFEERNTEESEHYHRFLYRVKNFLEQYKWFSVSPFLSAEVEKFKKTLTENIFHNNYPVQESAVISPNSRTGEEKIYEAIFSGNHTSLNWSDKLCDADEKIFSQFPVGLFKGEGKESVKFFPGRSAGIDLWKISNDNEIVIYELKTKNKKVGIVTELMFYASYMRDMFINNNNTWIPSKPKDGEFRGYNELYEAYGKKKLGGIKAYMLFDEIHPLLEDGKVLKLMNQNSDMITYGQISYKIIPPPTTRSSS